MIRLTSKTFKNVSELNNYLQQKINVILIDTVSDVVRDELESSAIEMLNEYNPILYKRRSSTNSLGSGGIADKETMNTELVSDGVIVITPNAERNKDFNNFPGWGYDENKSLAENLVFGYGNRQYPWNQPRDFVDDARNSLKSGKAHVEAMRDGLKEIFGNENVF